MDTHIGWALVPPPPSRIEEVVPLSTPFPNPVLLIETDVEPDRTVERAMLIQTEPGQITIERLRRGLVRKITVLEPPIRDRPRHPMDQLTNRTFATAGMRISAVGNISIEIFRHRDLGGQRTPGFWDFDILLAKDHLPAVIGDLRHATLPLDLVKRRDAVLAEKALKFQAALLLARARSSDTRPQITGSDTCFQFDHLGGFLKCSE